MFKLFWRATYYSLDCRTNIDCPTGKYCTTHNWVAGGNAEPGYYAPDDVGIGECKGNIRPIPKIQTFLK